ncbi:MAG: InlB B-repeat-containing protein, partial [Armatimonadota bacterium]
MIRRKKLCWSIMFTIIFCISVIVVLPVVSAPGSSYTYTTSADFDEGTLNNVVHTPEDQLQLKDVAEPFNFIWVAVSSKGTVVKINTKTGDIVGEYYTSPEGMSRNPSRTTVDAKGNVWVTNRDESGYVYAGSISPGIVPSGPKYQNKRSPRKITNDISSLVTPPVDRYMGSVTYIGSPDTIWIDRNGNGVCDTSTGYGDIKPWTNPDGMNTLGGSKMNLSAEDECIIHFVRVNSHGARHVSVNAENDVWVSGTGGRHFDLIDDETGKIIRQENSIGYGGYGGLIDRNGVIWSSNHLLRWDTSLPLLPANAMTYSHDSYGLGIDSQGNVWNTSLSGNKIHKFAPDGSLLGSFSHGAYYAQGCVADRKGDIWIAHSLYESSIGHILNDGTFVGTIFLDSGAGPTGVAVDSDGFIWATGHNTGIVYKIDPNAGPLGDDGVTPVGEVVWRSPYLGGNLYNYSDMTGSTIVAAPSNGSWTIIHDSTIDNAEWGYLSWDANEPGDSSITVIAASSNDGITFSAPETAQSDGDLAVPNGRYLSVKVLFNRSSTDENEDGKKDSPVLYEIEVKQSRQATLTVTKTGNGNGLVTSVPAGINFGSVGTALFDQGVIVDLTALPDQDSVFSGWSGSITGTGIGRVVMDADKAVQATFTLKPPVIETENNNSTQRANGVNWVRGNTGYLNSFYDQDWYTFTINSSS